MKKYWQNLRPFEKRVVVAVLAGLFIVFNLWFVIPHFSDLARTKTRMQEAQYALGIRQAAIGQINFYETEIRKLQKDSADVQSEDQILQFQHAVQEEEIKSGVNPQSAGRIQTRTNQFFLEQSQTINVQSGEQQLVDFLYNLGSGNSSIRVRDLGLRPDAQTRQQLAGTIKLVASYQKTSKPAAAKPVPGKPAGVPAQTSRAATQPPPKSSNPSPQTPKKTAQTP